MYFITGSTGFIGKQLVLRLYRRKQAIYLLLHERERNFFEQLKERFNQQAKHIIPLYGDVSLSNFGLDSQTVEEMKKHVKVFFHFAEVTGLHLDQKTAQQINVQGTINAVELANQLQCPIHFLSSIAVGGDYPKVFKESMLVEGQVLNTPYAESKYQAEIIIRQKARVPYRIYRPGIVVGSSESGEAAAIDGPYHLFRLIRQLRDTLPKWAPLLGIKGGRWYLSPVDYIADAIDHIAHEAGLDGKTFHLCRNRPNSVGDVINEFCRVAHAPRFKLQLEKNLIDYLPDLPFFKVNPLPLKLPMKGLLNQQLMEILGFPENFLSFINWRTRFDNAETRKALDGSGIECPHINLYAGKLWNYWEYHMAPLLSNHARAYEMARTLKDTPRVITDGKKLTQVIRERWQFATSEGRDNMARVLEGKTVLLTGGSSGIGRSMAHRLAKAKGKVILIARSEDKLRLVQREVEELGGTAFIYTCNLSDPDACKHLVDRVLQDHGRVDVLINNAGRSIRRPIHQAYDRLHDFRRTMDLNYFGCVQLILGFLPGMRANKYGHIINISTIGCQTHVPRFSAYIASKSALDAFSRTIASEVVHDNICITEVFMPLVRTPMIAPTKMYDYIPTLSPDKAAKMALRPLVSKKKRVATPLGVFAETLHSVSPKLSQIILNFGFRLFPDQASPVTDATNTAPDALSPGSILFAYLSKGIHW